MKKNIILFHHEFCVSGGAEHTLFEVMDYLNQENYSYQCWASIVNKKNCFPEKINDYNIHSFLPYFKFIPREFYPIITAILSPILLLRFRKASIFYGANQSGPFFAYVASLIHRKPYIIYMPYPLAILYPRKIDTEFKERKNFSLIGKIILAQTKPILFKLDSAVIKKAAAVLSEGDYSVQLFKNIYKREIINAQAGAKVISEQELNSIDKFNGNFPVQKPFILLTNRHEPKKKFEYAVEVLKIIREKFSNINQKTPLLVITGSPTEYTKSLLALMDKYNLNDLIIFTGLISEPQIIDYYKHAAVYVYTAPEEDYGKGVIQSIANGTPAVVWDSAGPRKNIKEGKTGFKIPLTNLQLFSDKIILLLSDTNLNKQFSVNAREDALENFSIQKHKQIILDTIQNTILNKPTH